MIEFAKIRQVANEMIQKHNLEGWKFEFEGNRSRGGKIRRLGRCLINPNTKSKWIFLTVEYVSRAKEEDVIDTLLHEVAHAMVGLHHGHDRVWKAKARQLGSSGTRLKRPMWGDRQPLAA
jgi:hypothetical protein